MSSVHTCITCTHTCTDRQPNIHFRIASLSDWFATERSLPLALLLLYSPARLIINIGCLSCSSANNAKSADNRGSYQFGRLVGAHRIPRFPFQCRQVSSAGMVQSPSLAQGFFTLYTHPAVQATGLENRLFEITGALDPSGPSRPTPEREPQCPQIAGAHCFMRFADGATSTAKIDGGLVDVALR